MSLFGEIVEPGTRTAWEDWDENIQSETLTNHTNLEWHRDVAVPTQIEKFVILEGRYIADSIKSLTKFRLEHVNVIQPANINLYRSESSDVYVCVLRDYNLLMASEIVDLLKMYIALSNDVVAILTKPIAEYQATEYIRHEYVIRSLKTSKPLRLSLGKKITKLEQPNIISGVTAGVITLREMNNQSGIAIVCYMEHNDEYQIKELQELLAQLNFGPVEPHSNSILNSNLYI